MQDPLLLALSMCCEKCKSDGWKWIWVFDKSSCQTAMVEDMLDITRRPGGKQLKMRDTIWVGKLQKLCFNVGVPKRMNITEAESGQFRVIYKKWMRANMS